MYVSRDLLFAANVEATADDYGAADRRGSGAPPLGNGGGMRTAGPICVPSLTPAGKSPCAALVDDPPAKTSWQPPLRQHVEQAGDEAGDNAGQN